MKLYKDIQFCVGLWDREMTYAEVIKKAKREIKNRKDYGTKKVPFKLCETWLEGNQINLWTYWQGYQIKDIDKGVDILLVGQDWGNPWHEENEETMKRIVAIQQGRNVMYYSGSPTGKMLVELFEILGCDILSLEPGKRLFFTNYSLGYRTKSETGGMTKGLMLKDKELFDDLVVAIKPKIIICLGKLTYEVVSGVRADGFVKQLQKGIPFKSSYPLNDAIPVYGVAHCGARGMSNVGGKETMKKAWKRIADEYNSV